MNRYREFHTWLLSFASPGLSPARARQRQRRPATLVHPSGASWKGSHQEE